MRLENYFALGLSTPQHLASWMFIASMALKLTSTLILLLHRHVRRLAWVSGHIDFWWWSTKVSALVLCASAGTLCWLGNDPLGQGLFAVLFIVACFMVAGMLRKRRAMSRDYS